MISAKDINTSKDIHNELAWLEVYQAILYATIWTNNVYEVKISDDDLKHTNQVQFRDSEESEYVWNKLESLGYKASSYYDYPNGNGDSGIKISWGEV